MSDEPVRRCERWESNIRFAAITEQRYESYPFNWSFCRIRLRFGDLCDQPSILEGEWCVTLTDAGRRAETAGPAGSHYAENKTSSTQGGTGNRASRFGRTVPAIR